MDDSVIPEVKLVRTGEMTEDPGTYYDAAWQRLQVLQKEHLLQR